MQQFNKPQSFIVDDQLILVNGSRRLFVDDATVLDLSDGKGVNDDVDNSIDGCSDLQA